MSCAVGCHNTLTLDLMTIFSEPAFALRTLRKNVGGKGRKKRLTAASTCSQGTKMHFPSFFLESFSEHLRT